MQESEILLTFIKVHLEKAVVVPGVCRKRAVCNSQLLHAAHLHRKSEIPQSTTATTFWVTAAMKPPRASPCSRPGWSGYARSSRGTAKGNEKEALSTICCSLRRNPHSAKGVH